MFEANSSYMKRYSELNEHKSQPTCRIPRDAMVPWCSNEKEHLERLNNKTF